MTTILSYTCDAFSIILTDNRTNHGLNQEFGYDDNRKKLFSLNRMGWSCGAGLSSFLIDVKDELLKSEVKVNDDIRKIFDRVAISSKNKDSDMTECINNSVLVSSWVGSDADGIYFRVGILCLEHFDSTMMSLAKYIVDIVYPGDYLNDQEKIESLHRKYNLKLVGNDLVGNDFEAVSELMFRVFKDISEISTQVSSTCDMGILSFSETKMHKMKISGEVDTLLEAIRKGTLRDFIEECP